MNYLIYFSCFFPDIGSGINVPSFNVTSYAAYPTIVDAIRDVIIEMRIKLTSLDDGIFLYNAKDNNGNDDYIALAMKNGQVEFSYDSGSGIQLVHRYRSIRGFIKRWQDVRGMSSSCINLLNKNVLYSAFSI